MSRGEPNERGTALELSTAGVVDMSRVMRMLQQVWELADGLHGVPMPDPGAPAGTRGTETAELLHAAHLAELCRTEILGQYQRVKSQGRSSVSA